MPILFSEFPGFCRRFLLALVLLSAVQVHAQQADWAPIAPLATESLLLDITRAGDRLVVVGSRGHVLYSDDEGRHWTQARVPTRQMLTSVFFIDARTGWAVGHDGMILKTIDAGATWSIQRDGLMHQVDLDQRALARARQRVAELSRQLDEHPDNDLESALEEAQLDLEDAQWRVEQPVFAPPLMDIYFADATRGWATGAFGTLLTTEDGGHTWRSIGQRLDNPQGMHLNAIVPARSGRLLIAGENGVLFLSDPQRTDWRALDTPYHGTWFGALYLRDRQRLLVFGLQGNAWYSDNNGRDWLASSTVTDNSLAGGYTDDRGNVLLAGGVGLVLVSRDGGETFEPLQLRLRESLSGVLEVSRNELVTVGMSGIRLIDPRMKKED